MEVYDRTAMSRWRKDMMLRLVIRNMEPRSKQWYYMR